MIELIKLQFHGLKNNAERISLRSSPRSPQVCLRVLNRQAKYNCKEYKNWQSWKFPVLGVVFLHFRFWDHISGFARFARFANNIYLGKTRERGLSNHVVNSGKVGAQTLQIRRESFDTKINLTKVGTCAPTTQI